MAPIVAYLYKQVFPYIDDWRFVALWGPSDKTGCFIFEFTSLLRNLCQFEEISSCSYSRDPIHWGTIRLYPGQGFFTGRQGSFHLDFGEAGSRSQVIPSSGRSAAAKTHGSSNCRCILCKTEYAALASNFPLSIQIPFVFPEKVDKNSVSSSPGSCLVATTRPCFSRHPISTASSVPGSNKRCFSPRLRCSLWDSYVLKTFGLQRTVFYTSVFLS